jgi:PAS domain S-box-containing protein
MVSAESGVTEEAKRASVPSTALIVGLSVFAACYLGILTRPTGLLAMVWPANALLLGLLIRMRGTNHPSVWLAAAVGYMAADLLAGTDPGRALLLNAANMAGVGAGYLFYRLLPPDALRMREPSSILCIVLISADAAAVSGLAAAAGDALFLRVGSESNWPYWFANELVNYVALLPTILSAPPLRALLSALRRPQPVSARTVLPVLVLAASCVLALVIGGPGAIAFAVPALLWCGQVYSVFTVSVLAFAVSFWSLTVVAHGYLPAAPELFDGQAVISIRLAAFLIVLAPITLAMMARSRDELVRTLSLARKRVDLAMEASGIMAVWDLNVANNDFAIEGRFHKSPETGEAGASDLHHDFLTNLTHPDDRERVLDALGTAMATGADYHCRYRALMPSGEMRWVAAFGKPLRDDKNVVTHLAGILIDVTEQAEAAEALQQSNMRFNIVSESIPQIVWSTDANGRHDYFNRRWNEFTGVAPADLTPQTWEGLVHPDDKARVDIAWAASLASGEPYSIDYRFRYRNGTYRWLKVEAKPFRNRDGAIARWYGTSTDIDEAKQLEAEREIVARELDHRIGNLFALAAGLVSLAARDAPDVASLRTALHGRLKALHDAHTLIRRHDGASASLSELLRALLVPYDDHDGRIAITGDDLPVGYSAMTSIALIFHELATNAVKYGALRCRDGRLRLELSRAGALFRIRWLEEASCAPPAAGQGTGFGSKLFTSIIEGQLRGRVTRSVSESGLVVELELPVASLTGQAGDA